MNISDTTLLERWIHRGDPEAMAAIIKRHSAMVYATCRRVTGNATDAEDVAQECFLKLASVRHAGESLAGLLHTTATRLALNKSRGDARRRAREAEYTAMNTAPEGATWDDVQPLIDEAIAALPEKRRSAVVRHFLQGETHAEIARDLGVSRAAISQQVARGVEEVRETLRKRGVMVLTASLTAMLVASRAGAVPASVMLALGRLAVSGAGCGSGTAAAKNVVAAGWAGLLVKSLLGAAAVAGLAFVLLGRPSENLVQQANRSVAPTRNLAPEDLPAESPSTPPPTPSIVGVENRDPELSVEPEIGNGTIRVYVTDRVGEPISRAMVRLEKRDPDWGFTSSGFTEVQCDTVGEAQFSGQPWGRYLVSVQHEGQASRSVAHLDADNPVSNLDLTLQTAGAISGQVLDASNAPVVGAEVALLDLRASSLKLQVAASGDDGAFAIADVPLGRYNLQVSAKGFAPTVLREVSTDAQPLDVVLERGGSVSGVVRQASNRAPVPGMPLRLKADGYPDGEFSANTDERGEFQMEGLPEGLIQITSDDTRYAMSPAQVSVKMSAGQTTDVELLVESGATISGHVLDDSSGAPIPGAVVVAADPTYGMGGRRSTPADAEGRYTLNGLSSGTLVVSVSTAPKPYSAGAWGVRRQQTVELQPGETQDGVDLALDLGLVVSGVVVNERDEPVPGAEVSLGRANREGELFDFRDVLAGANGAFCFTAVFTGTDPEGESLHEAQDLALEADFRSSRSEPVWLEAVTDSVTDVRLKLLPQPSGVIAGVVVDSSGKPAVAALSLHHPLVDNHLDSGLSRTDAEGYFLFQNLAAGDYEIMGVLDSGTGQNAMKKTLHALTLAPGQRVTNLRFELDSIGFITGRIADESGTSLQSYRVEAWDVETGDYASSGVTDAQGHFKIAVEGDGVFELRPSEQAPGGFWRKAAKAGDDVFVTLTAEVLQGTQPNPASYTIDPETGEERIEWPEGSAGPPSAAE